MGLLAAEGFYRIGEGRPHRLEADGEEGDGEGEGGGEAEDPPVDGGAVLVALEPAVEEPVGEGEGDDTGDGDELYELL